MTHIIGDFITNTLCCDLKNIEGCIIGLKGKIGKKWKREGDAVIGSFDLFDNLC